MSTIKIKCIDQVLTFTNTPVITTGNQNIDRIDIDFCPLWDRFVKVGVFFQQTGVFSYSVINADGSCPVPNSISNLTGKIYFAVSGTNSKNQVRTSNIVCYTIEEGVADAHIQDEFPADIPEDEKEDIYNKMLELVTEMQTLTQDLIKNFAYVRIKDGNEFSYGVDQLQAQIRAYTYEKEVIDQKISALNNLIDKKTGALNNLIDETNRSVNILSETVANNTKKINMNEENIGLLGTDVETLKNTTVNKETYLRDQQDLQDWRDSIEKRLEAWEG